MLAISCVTVHTGFLFYCCLFSLCRTNWHRCSVRTRRKNSSRIFFHRKKENHRAGNRKKYSRLSTSAPGLTPPPVAKRFNGRKSAEGRRSHRLDEGRLSAAPAASPASPTCRGRQEAGRKMLETHGQGTVNYKTLFKRAIKDPNWE